MNEGCVVVQRPHPSHLFIVPHPPVYEIARAPQEKFQWMKFQHMRNQCLQDEGGDCSSHRKRAFVWDFEGSYRVPKVFNGVSFQ